MTGPDGAAQACCKGQLLSLVEEKFLRPVRASAKICASRLARLKPKPIMGGVEWGGVGAPAEAEVRVLSHCLLHIYI